MTPNNILNMVMLKGLDLVAITDHNSTKQLKIINELKDSYDFTIIPGVEVSVNEGFDVLCYFKTFEDALSFDSYLEKHLNGEWKTYSKENQIITDIYDLTLEEFDIPLASTSIKYEDLYKEVKKYNGLVIPAHIDRKSCTPLNVFNVDDMELDGVELSPYGKDSFIEKNPSIMKYKMLHNSDSHTLLTIHEKEYFLELDENSIESFFRYFEVI